MKATPILLFVAAMLAGTASAQNATDDYPNAPPGFLLTLTNGTASANGLINYAEDKDVFAFTVGGAATPATAVNASIYTTGITDTRGVLRRQTSTGWNTLVTEEGDAGNFRISRALEPGQYSIEVTGKLTPSAAGAISGAYGLRVELTPNTPPTATPDIDLPGAPRGSSQTFGSIQTNTSASRTFSVKNTGLANLQLTAVTLLAGADGAIGGVPAGTTTAFRIEEGGARTIAPGASSSFRVVFNPLAAGTFTSSVQVSSNDPDENPWIFFVSGAGVAPPPPGGGEIKVTRGDTDIPSGGTVDFGVVVTPGSGPVVRELVISNTGEGDLHIGGVVISPLPTAGLLPDPPAGFFRVLSPPASVVPAGRSTVLRLGAGSEAAVPPQRYTVQALIENSDSDENPYRLLLTAEVQNAPPPPPPASGEIDVFSGDMALTDDGTLDFGTTPTGKPVSKLLTIKNTGDGELKISGIRVEWDGPIIAIFPPPPPPFTVDGVEPRIVAPGASTSCRVTFPATFPGPAGALLLIGSSDADENPFTLTLKAGAEGDNQPPPAPEIAVSMENADVPQGGTVDFGTTSLTVPVTRTLTISNKGAATLQVRAAIVQVKNAVNVVLPFRLAGEPFSSVAPGASRALKVVFQPVADGTYGAMLVLANNDADENPYRLRLTGKGGTGPAAIPDISLSLGGVDLGMNALVDFGVAAPGTSVTKEIKVSNSGTGDLKLGGITFSAATTAGGNVPGIDPAGPDANGILPPIGALPFRALPPPDNVVPAGGSAILRVVYMAPPSGTQMAIIAIASNDPDENPYRLVLKGASGGVAPVPPDIAVRAGDAELPIGGTLSFGDVVIGAPVRRSITIANTGGGELRITGFSIYPAEATANTAGVPGGIWTPPNALVRVVSGSGVVAPGASSVFVLEMMGFEAGPANFYARISSNDPNENPYTFKVTGKVVEAPVAVPPIPIPDDPNGATP